MGSKWTSRVCRFWTRVLLRLIQFGSSLVAYIALQTVGFTSYTTAGGQTVPVIVSSGALDFARIINFLAFVYAFFFLICVEWLRLCVRSVHVCEKVMDLTIVVCLTVATLVLLLSKITLQCQWGYGRFLQCGQLYLGIAMSFLSMLAFLATTLLGMKENHNEEYSRDDAAQQQEHNRDTQASYVNQDSPRAGATPVPIVTAQPVH